MKPRSAKNKGARFQKDIAKKISEITNIPVEKDGELESRPMSQAGVDIILRGKALKLFPFSVECCCAEQWAVNSKVSQAKKNVMKDTNWLCFFKRNRETPIVILDSDLFFKIYGDYLKLMGLV